MSYIRVEFDKNIKPSKTKQQKKLITKFAVLILLCILICATIFSIAACSITNPKKTQKIIGELYACLNIHSDSEIEKFLHSYRNHELKITHRNHRAFSQVFSYVRLTYNTYLEDVGELIEVLIDDERINWVSSETYFPKGELIIHLLDNIKEEKFIDFFLSYSDYDLKLLFHDKISNRIRIFYDREMMNEFDFIELLEKDNRVRWAFFEPYLPDWEQGTIFGRFFEQVTDDEIDSIIQIWSEKYEVIIGTGIGRGFFTIYFDYVIFDEFELLKNIIDNPKVDYATFNYYATLD